MKIAIKEADKVNYLVYFIVCYLMVYSVSILFGIIIDVFNCGQTTLIERKKKDENDDDKNSPID